jgi:methylmalonyl-CoA/ethylmalonyl-CoA epimerase
MPLMKFDHIGLFVRDLAHGRETLATILPVGQWTAPVDDPLIRVSVQFGLDPAGIRYELVAPFGPGNPVEGALAAGTNILNHVAYLTPDLDAEIRRQRRAGAVPTGPARPAVAFGGRRVIFLLTPLRFILELIEEG